MNDEARMTNDCVASSSTCSSFVIRISSFPGHFSSPRETTARAWLSIFGAQLVSRLNLSRGLQCPSPASRKHSRERVRFDFQSRSDPEVFLREQVHRSPECRHDRKFPGLARANAKRAKPL